MMACKKALVATDWDLDKAKEYIKDHPERTYVMFES
jgi:translation elongation factor EF-Ts